MYSPNDIFPLTNIQPFTERDTYTFIERIVHLSQLFVNLTANFSTTVENVTEIVNTLNNRIGSPEVIHVDLSNGNVAVKLPHELPDNHVFFIVVRQGDTGGNKVTLPSNISGSFTLDQTPNSYSLIRVVPKGGQKFYVDETADKLYQKITQLDNKLVGDIDNTNTALSDFKISVQQSFETVKQSITTTGQQIVKEVNDRKAADTAIDAAMAQFSATTAQNFAAVRSEASALETKLTNNLNAVSTALGDRITATADSLTNTINTLNNNLTAKINDLKATKVDKSTFINVLDYGAKGDGTTDDTEAIKRAIVAGGEGQTIYFPKGKYLITNTIKMMLGQRWVGSAFNNDQTTVLSQSHIKFTHAGVAIEAASGQIKSMRIEGPGYSKAGSVGLYIPASSFVGYDVAIRNCANGIVAKESWYCTLNNFHLYQNSTAIDVNYCYNFVLNNVRMHCDRGDGTWSTGINMQGRPMITLNTGSIEAFSTAINMAAGGSLACFGTYFESREKNGNTGGIAVKGDYSFSQNILMVGCQAYLTGLAAFVDMTYNQGGERITGIGNMFKSSGPGATPCVAYRWLNGHNASLSFTLLGDAFQSAKGDGHRYISNNAAIPLGSLIAPPGGTPVGSNGELVQGVLSYGGSIAAHSNGNTIGALQPASVSSVVPAGSMPEGWSGNRVGAMVFNTTTKKPNFWTGSGWVDAAGNAVS